MTFMSAATAPRARRSSSHKVKLEKFSLITTKVTHVCDPFYDSRYINRYIGIFLNSIYLFLGLIYNHMILFNFKCSFRRRSDSKIPKRQSKLFETTIREHLCFLADANALAGKARRAADAFPKMPAARVFQDATVLLSALNFPYGTFSA